MPTEHDRFRTVRVPARFFDPATALAMRIPRFRGVVRRVRRTRSRVVDRWLRVETAAATGTVVSERLVGTDALWYEPTDYFLMRQLLRRLPLRDSDVVLDLGCGKARPLMVLGRRRLRLCQGVELDPVLADVAVENARRLRGRRTPIEISCRDAIHFDYDETTVVWFFNSFGPGTLRLALDSIEQSLDRNPRVFRFVYVNPAYECELERRTWLVRTESFSSAWHRTYGASYWESWGVRPPTASSDRRVVEPRVRASTEDARLNR